MLHRIRLTGPSADLFRLTLSQDLGKAGRGFHKLICSPKNAITGFYFSVDCADFASGSATCWSKYTAVNFLSSFISSADGLPPW